jgi:hypothetical protein
MFHYDATKEHQKLDRTAKGKADGRHPNKKQNTPHPVTGKYSKYR